MSDANLETGCAAIVLAAGSSSRLGQPKQLLTVNGESLLHRTVRFAAEAGCAPILVVLGFESNRIQLEISDLETKIVINSDWQSGMGSSLRCGIDSLMKECPAPQKTLLLLSDQAKLSSGILVDLVRASAEGNPLITASRYAGRLGVPAIFQKQLYSELLKLEGDQGARSLIQHYLNQTTAVDFPDGAIDIDTPQDLTSLENIPQD
jgi:molybdenum cofactor cytidylyltransferase